MARTAADFNTKTPTARLKLAVREKSYNRSAGAHRLGYIRRAELNGKWLVIESVPGTKLIKTRVIGLADDLTRADGVDVLTFEQAMEIASKGASLGAPAAAAITVFGAIDAYYAVKASEGKHAVKYRDLIKSKIAPELGNSRVDRVSKTQIEMFRASLVRDDIADAEAIRASQATANRVMTMLRAPLSWAFADDKNGIPSDSAWRKVKNYRGVDQGRKADIAPEDVEKLIAAAATFDTFLADLLAACYITGMRGPHEPSALNVGDFDAKNQVLTIPGDTKTGPRAVALDTDAVAFFKRLAKDKLPGAPLVPRNARGDRWPKSGQCRPVKRALKLAGLSSEISLYTLRHAHISRSIENGMSLSVLAKNCGTSMGMIQQNYAKVLGKVHQAQVQQFAPKLRVAA